MTNHQIDNSIKDLGKVVLWQYDRAVRLLSILKHMHVLYFCAVEQFWRFWENRVLSIDTCSDFGLSLWGMFIGVPPPVIVDNTGISRFVKPSVYKKLLKGAFNLLRANSSFEGILGYLETVFGVDGKDNLTKWVASVSEYGWTTNVDELNFRYVPNRSYSEGYVFWYDENGDGSDTNWKCTRDITSSENTSFEAIRPYLAETTDTPTGSDSTGTIFLHLIDPEGIVRKISAGTKDSLRIDVSYEYGEYVITASVVRVQKCGVSVVDNGDMSLTYVKTPYYDQMHRDQKALFEQLQDEVCPYPLGVKTNEQAETWLFGFDGQQPNAEDEYTPNTAYAAGTVVWRIDGDYHGFHWKFKEDVSAAKNKSFEAIKDYVEKTDEGDPFISGIADTEAFDTPAPAYRSTQMGEYRGMRTVYANSLNTDTSIMPLVVDGQSILNSASNDIPT